MVSFETQRINMVDSQIRPSDVTEYPLIEAMLEIPREAFVPADRRPMAYADTNIELAPCRVLLAPRTFARMVDGLDITDSDLVLDVGAGLGYTSAVLARLAQAVIALEEIPELAEEADRRLAEAGADNVAVVQGPLAAGDPRHAPFDVIIIEGGAEELPAALVEQLKEGGRVGMVRRQGALGTVTVGLKEHGSITWRNVFHAGAPVMPGFARAPGFVF